MNETDAGAYTLAGRGFSATVDHGGNIQALSHGERTIRFTLEKTLYEVDGEIADCAEVPAVSAEARRAPEPHFALKTKDKSATLTISSGQEIRFRVETPAKSAGIALSFPVEAEFHLPEYMNLGRKIDSDMPVGQWYSTSRYAEQFSYMRGLSYNFFLARVGDLWIRFMARYGDGVEAVRRCDFHVRRHPESFRVTFSWRTPAEACVAVFSSMEEAVEDYTDWLSKRLAVAKMRDRPNLPRWVNDVKLVITLDMLHSNWAVANSYADAARIAEELRRIGCPRETLFYLPGWNGAYDSAYPTYRPHPDLGGEKGFRSMMDAMHANGFRVMIHTNPWGIDPYHPDIDRLLKYAVKDKNGDYAGFKTGTLTKWGHIAPQLTPMKFRTGETRFGAAKGSRAFAFQTVAIPDDCEARITVGGFEVSDARIRFTIGRRSISTPSGWLRDKTEFSFPFPMLLAPGANTVNVEVTEGAAPSWSGCWYRIDSCPYTGRESHPILFADTQNPEWIEIVVAEISFAVETYGIDAVHMDATEVCPNQALCDAVARRLPGIALGGEAFDTLSELGYWAFMQQGMQNMVGYLDVMRGTQKQATLPDTWELEKLYSWLDKPSPVSGFVKDYVAIYPHLIAAGAFVPVSWSGHPEGWPRNKADLWKILRDAPRMGYVPGFRLVYRDGGLDEESLKAIREIAARRQ